MEEGEFQGHAYQLHFTEVSAGKCRWVVTIDNKTVEQMDGRPVDAEWARAEARSAAERYIERTFRK